MRDAMGQNKSDNTAMDRYKETFETWNNVASSYQDKFMYLDLYNDTYDFVCTSINKPNASILEIGCGPGNITKYLLSKKPDLDIFGIDIAPKMIELAQKNNSTARFEIMDCRHIKSIKTKFDAIIGGFCLPYLSQQESAELISDSHKLLNNDGILYLSFVEGEPDKSEYKPGIGGRVYFNYHKLEDIKTPMNKFKFQELKMFNIPYKISETEFDSHTVIIAKKRVL